MSNRRSPSPANGDNAFLGRYACPLCNQHLTVPLKGNKQQLLLAIRLPENHYFSLPSHQCPHCHRKMMLQSIVDQNGQVLIDVYQWMGREISRMKRSI